MPKGVRLNPKHDERTRAKIQTSQIINRLEKFVKGDVELNAAQVTAALGLLRKTLPDLSSVEMTAEVNNRYTVDLTQYNTKELEQLERLVGKATVIEPDQSGTGETEPDTLH